MDTTASLRSILPSCVAVSERHNDRDFEELYPQELEYLGPAVPKRRVEFTTSRRCARDALAALDIQRPPLVPGVAGAPIWPDGIVGSITHCEGYRAAVVARVGEVLSIGVDAEPARVLPPGVLDMVGLAPEISRIDALESRFPDVPWDRLLFCAKEAVYKTWFPLERTWLGFEDADIVISPAGQFKASITRPLRLPNGCEISELKGGWTSDGRHILASITILPPARCYEVYSISSASGGDHDEASSDDSLKLPNRIWGVNTRPS